MSAACASWVGAAFAAGAEEDPAAVCDGPCWSTHCRPGCDCACEVEGVCGVDEVPAAVAAFFGLRPRFAPVPRVAGAPPRAGVDGVPEGMNERSGAGYVANGEVMFLLCGDRCRRVDNSMDRSQWWCRVEHRLLSSQNMNE